MLSVPGRHNAAERPGGACGDGARRLATSRSCEPPESFPGMLRRQELQGHALWRRRLRRLRAPPDRGPGDARCAARAGARAADRGLPAAPLLADEGARAPTSAPRWRPPTRWACSMSIAAREEPVGPLEGVSGLDGRPRDRGPRRAASRSVAPRSRDRRRAPGAAAAGGRPAGDDRRRRHLQARGGAWWRDEASRRTFPLARLTTVRAGGNAELFARPETEEELVELLGWAAQGGHPVEIVGSGSNLLVADDGVPGLVLKLDGELTALERDGTHVLCGGGAAAAIGSGQGRPLGADRPGVRHQHPWHRRRRREDERQRLRRRACGRAGMGQRLRAGRGRAPRPERARLRATGNRTSARARSCRARRSPWPSRSRRCEGDAGRDAGEAPGGAALGDQDLRLDLQEPRRPARRGTERREAARRRGRPWPRVGGARFSQSTRTSSRTRARRRRPTSSR